MSAPINTFIVYARDDQAIKQRLLKHLFVFTKPPFNMAIWHDEHIDAGAEWERKIRDRLENTDIFIMLISIDFLNSQFIYDVEFKAAVARQKAGKSIILPVIIKPCVWYTDFHLGEYTFNFRQLQVLPKEGRPLSDWPSEDHGLHDIAESIRMLLENMREEEKIRKSRSEEEKEKEKKHQADLQKRKREEEENERLLKQKKEDEKAWIIAKQKNTVTSYTSYLHSYLIGNYRNNANSAISELKAAEAEKIKQAANQLELDTWNNVKKQNTIASYEDYLSRYSGGKYKTKAMELIEKLRQQTPKKAFTGVSPLSNKVTPGQLETDQLTRQGLVGGMPAAGSAAPYNYAKDVVWWLILPLIIAISIGAFVLTQSILGGWLYSMDIPLRFYRIPQVILLVAGIFWGVAYARCGALEYNSAVGSFRGLIEPFWMIFNDGQVFTGLFSLPIVNAIIMLILLWGLTYLLLLLGLDGFISQVIGFIIINFFAIRAFWRIS